MDEFLIDAGYVSWFGGPDVSMFQASFDQGAYSDALLGAIGDGYGVFVDKAVTKRKAEFVAGRYCAHQALSALGVAPGLIGIAEARNPVWPRGIVGSISHSHGYAISATAKRSSKLMLGLDVEDMVAPQTAKRLEASVINDDELDLLRQAPRPEALFTLIFSVKESFYKAAYPWVKRYFGFKAISVTGVTWKSGCLDFSINEYLGGIFKPGMVFSAAFKTMDDKRIVTYFDVSRDDERFRHLFETVE